MSSSGKATSPTVTIANANGKLTALVVFFDDLLGARFERRQTLVKYLDGRPDADPTAEYPTEIWKVNQKTSHDKNLISFSLSSPMDFKNKQLPGRQIIANQCPWRYRGADCGYTGPPVADKWDIITTDADKDDCSKLVRGCKFRFGEEGQLRHGGFPAAGLVR
jgi:lambda family phage minor tail protein L